MRACQMVSRVNVAISPVAIDGPLVSIRKFAARPFTLELLVANGTFTVEVAALSARHRAVPAERAHLGGNGLRQDDDAERDVAPYRRRERISHRRPAELQLQQIHVARMETVAQRGRPRRDPPARAGEDALRMRRTGSSSARCAAAKLSTCCRQ